MRIRLGIVNGIHFTRIPLQGKDSSLRHVAWPPRPHWELILHGTPGIFTSPTVSHGSMRALQRCHADPQGTGSILKRHNTTTGRSGRVLMRKDPPSIMNSLYARTFLKRQKKRAGAFVVQSRASLRDVQWGKLFATQVPQLPPEHVVTRRADILRAFAKKHRWTSFFKPLDEWRFDDFSHSGKRVPKPQSVGHETLSPVRSAADLASVICRNFKDGDKAS